MAVTIISDEMLRDLNNGRVIDLDLGPVTISIASEEWGRKQEQISEEKFKRYLEGHNNEIKEFFGGKKKFDEMLESDCSECKDFYNCPSDIKKDCPDKKAIE